MRPNDPSRRLVEIRRQLADLISSPCDNVTMFDIRCDGLRKLEAHLVTQCDERGLAHSS